MPRMLRSPELRRALVALAGCWALAVLITWPAMIEPSTGMVGHPGNDTWNHAWGYWWVYDGLAKHGGIPFHTRLLNHPDGGSLFFIDTFNAALASPLVALFGVPAAFNLAVTGSFAWTGFGAWVLAHRVLRDDAAAAVAAVVFSASAHLLGQAYDGITETLNAGWIPLYVAALLALIERPKLWRGVLAGALLGICALSNFYYGLFAGLLTAMVVLHRGITQPSRIRWRMVGLTGTVAAALAAAMVAPTLNQLSATMDAADAMVNRDPSFVWDSLLRHNVTDLVGFFRPGHHYSPDLKAIYGEDLVIVTYLGWTATALAATALALHRRRREMVLWAAILGVFLVFSLGPYLNVGGHYLRVSGRRIPLPFLPFFRAFPLFSRISHPFRFVVPATLGLAILAGQGTRLLLRGLGPVARVGAAALVCAAVLAEVLLGSPAVWPIPRSEAAIPRACSELEGPGAVLDLPITVPNLERAVYTWYQTAHHLPVPYGLNEPLPHRLAQNRLTAFMVRLEAGHVITLPHVLPDLELVAGARLLALQGYRYVVVHERLYTAPKRAMVRSVLDAVLGPPRMYPEDGVSVYELK